MQWYDPRDPGKTRPWMLDAPTVRMDYDDAPTAAATPWPQQIFSQPDNTETEAEPSRLDVIRDALNEWREDSPWLDMIALFLVFPVALTAPMVAVELLLGITGIMYIPVVGGIVTVAAVLGAGFASVALWDRFELLELLLGPW